MSFFECRASSPIKNGYPICQAPCLLQHSTIKKLALLRLASPSGRSMLGGRAGLCWVGGRVYASWREGGSMYAWWELPSPFLRRPISSRTRFLEGYGVCDLCWVGVGVYNVRAGGRAFRRACVRVCTCIFLVCVCMRAFYA